VIGNPGRVDAQLQRAEPAVRLVVVAAAYRAGTARTATAGPDGAADPAGEPRQAWASVMTAMLSARYAARHARCPGWRPTRWFPMTPLTCWSPWTPRTSSMWRSACRVSRLPLWSSAAATNFYTQELFPGHCCGRPGRPGTHLRRLGTPAGGQFHRDRPPHPRLHARGHTHPARALAPQPSR